MVLPPLVRLAAMVAIAPVALVLQPSALARPLSPRATHSEGAPTKVCWSVRRLAGKSMSRLRGIVTICPPTTMVPPDHTSVGFVRVSRSISPVINAVDGAARAVPSQDWAAPNREGTRIANARTRNRLLLINMVILASLQFGGTGFTVRPFDRAGHAARRATERGPVHAPWRNRAGLGLALPRVGRRLEEHGGRVCHGPVRR